MACTISCAACANYVHLGYLTDLYKGISTNILALKNSHEWLGGFLSFSGLCYTCKSCKAANKVGNTQKSCAGISDVESMSQVKNIIENVNKNLTDFIAGLDAWEESGKLGDKTYFNPVLSCGSNATQQLHSIENNKPMTYAGAASRNLSEAVKTTVERSFQVQRQVERDCLSLVIYNLAERSRDLADLHSLTKTINCPVEICKLYRMGKASSAGRPLRIFVSAPSDAERVLLRAHLLKDSTNYSSICIDKWLSREEMNCVKKLRQRCQKLNDSSVKRSDGKKLFIVISGRLMTQSDNGKLCVYKEPVSSNSGTSLVKAGKLPELTFQNNQMSPHSKQSSQQKAKNGAVRSHVAPSQQF